MTETKRIGVDGMPITFRASAAIPRLYRTQFRRDICKDPAVLEKSIGDGKSSDLDSFCLELFENIAWLMAERADPEHVPDTPDEWLDQFNTFSIYGILPQIISLWGVNVEQQVESKKTRQTDREMTTPLFLLRCVQLGLSIGELDLLTIGTVNDMYAEMSNDSYEYKVFANQEDFNRF